jgi:hypothetical protein
LYNGVKKKLKQLLGGRLGDHPNLSPLPEIGLSGPGTYAGTSIATAYVAGTLARYLSENPEAGRPEAIHYLKRVFK